ncbi:MAG: ATP-binding protein [Verrucomicrobiota bacterium JB023]|nr:ATP-binding protein [Verrucomicrobiota bacterium JB023]
MKQKILFGIAVFLLLLCGTGLVAIILLNHLSKNFTSANSQFMKEVTALQTLRFDTSTINVFYLPEMIKEGTPPPEVRSPDQFESGLASMKQSLGMMTHPNHAADRHFERLRTAIEGYEASYRKIFADFPEDPARKSLLLDEISDYTQQITDLSQGLLSTREANIRDYNAELSTSATRSSWLVGALMLFGLFASAQVYAYAKRSMVDPILDLTDSVRQIQHGNFELSLPVRRTKDEVAGLIPAFNEMAAELRLMRRATDEKLMRVDLLNRAILASFPHPIFLLDEAGNPLKMNPEAEKLMEDLSLLHGLPRRLEELTKIAIANEEEFLPERLDEAVLLRRDDKEYFYLPRIFKLSTLEDQAEGWVVLLTDVSRLRFFDDMKSNLIATVSHEIKTPLTGIRMVLHLMLEKRIGELNDTQEEMLSSAHLDCERLLETLRNLMQMSRLDSGADSLNLEEMEMSNLINGAISLFEQSALEKGITLEYKPAPDTPKVLADEIRIREVLNNLISNAIKHSPENSLIKVIEKPVGADFIRFAVLDQGSGVPEEAKGKIFDRFYRAPGQSSIEGIGLGLSIAREIVTAHNGRIGLKNGPNGETKFYFDLPRA